MGMPLLAPQAWQAHPSLTALSSTARGWSSATQGGPASATAPHAQAVTDLPERTEHAVLGQNVYQRLMLASVSLLCNLISLGLCKPELQVCLALVHHSQQGKQGTAQMMATACMHGAPVLVALYAMRQILCLASFCGILLQMQCSLHSDGTAYVSALMGIAWSAWASDARHQDA